MNCKHEWLVPSNKRTRCKRCGDDGWVSYDGKVHETYEACMNHDALSYGASPLSLPQKIESESSNEKVFKVPEGGYYRIGDQTVYLDADGSFKIKMPTQSGHEQTQVGHDLKLAQDFRNASGALAQALEEIAEMHTRNADLTAENERLKSEVSMSYIKQQLSEPTIARLELKLTLATDGLTTARDDIKDYITDVTGPLQRVDETLAKLKERK